MSVNEQLWLEAEKLAARNYDVETFRDTLTDGQVVIIAKHPELPGSMAHGANLDEALANLKAARIEYIYSLLEDNIEVPYPRAGATNTVVTPDYVNFQERTIVGLGSSNPSPHVDSKEENVGFSYQGDFVRTGH